MAKKLYRVINAIHCDEFEQQVTEALGEGWELQGGMTAVWENFKSERDGSNQTVWVYLQAMTKVEAPEQPVGGWIVRD